MSYQNKPVIAVVQARMQSQRLPGKAMKECAGHPSIFYILKRVAQSRYVDKIVFATSTKPENDALAKFVASQNIEVFRGSEDDVLERFCSCVKEQKDNYDFLVRVCADNFLSCPELIDLGIEILIDRNLDFVNPFLSPSYPFGSGAEVTTTKNLFTLETMTKNLDAKYREHVLLYAYEHSELFSFQSLQAPLHLSAPDLKISVDTSDDFERVKKFLETEKISANLEEIIKFYDKSHLHFRPGNKNDSETLLRWRNDPETRNNSISTDIVQAEEHRQWFEKSLNSKNRKIYIVEKSGEAVGTVRTDNDDKKVELSWTLAPEARGKGLGKEIVKEAVHRLSSSLVWAKIKTQNTASRKVAEYAGFKQLTEKDGLVFFTANQKPRLAIVTKGNSSYGWGHVMRSSRLLKSLKEAFSVSYIVDADSSIQEYLRKNDIPAIFSSKQMDTLEKLKSDLAIFDLLETPEPLLKITKSVVFNDIGKNYTNGDIFIQAQVLKNYPNLKNKINLNGPSYFPVADEILAQKRTAIAKEAKNLLIVLGGTLPQKYEETISTLIQKLPDMKCFIAGQKKEELPKQMAEADIALAAGGFTKYELAALGIPTLLVSIVEHQKELAEAFAKTGVADYLGRLDDLSVDKLAGAIVQLAQDFSRRKNMSEAGLKLVDGKGSARIIQTVAQTLFD